MAITIAGIELDRIQNLGIDERQSIVEHGIPGSQGNAFQNLGRLPVAIVIEGILQGERGSEQLQKLREKLKTGEKVAFTSEAATPTEIDQVIIKGLKVRQIAGKPQFYRYVIELKEVVEAPAGLPDAQALADIDTAILGEADQFLENLEDGLASLQDAAAVKAVVDQLSPKIQHLGELVKKLSG